MTPAMGKNTPTHTSFQGMSWPEELLSLGKYINRDVGKYCFWLEKIHQGLVVPKMTHEEEKEACSHGRYSYFSNFCEGI